MLGSLLGRRASGPPAREARVWSNQEIARLAPLISGSVVNVSAWKDEDKEGRRYRDYFAGAASYATTNYGGWRGTEGDAAATDHFVDLEEPLPDALRGAYDLAFNHTTLEHVFEFGRAFENICARSRDAALIVTPFLQHLHGPEDGDFWRPSPYAMRRFFARNGFTPLYESAGPEGGRVRYLLSFAARRPEDWAGRLPRPERDAEAVLRAPL
jgi:hypothetical protein